MRFEAMLATVGAAAIGILMGRILMFVIRYGGLSTSSLEKYKGSWAVVTGASAGIGAGFVRRLAEKGINVVLIARSVDKMNAIATECQTKYGIQTKVLPFDFASASSTDYASMTPVLTALQPAILVNNVGVNVPFPTEFVDMSTEAVDRIVKVNIESINRMTAMLLPGMLEAKKGIVFCLSSGGGAVGPGPLLSPYAGTKAYADAFAVSLSGEVASAGVFVHSLTPFFVESAMAKMRKSMTVPTPDAFAASALSMVGTTPRLSPHWAHYIMGVALTSLPLTLQVTLVTKMHRDIRRRALRKQERLSKQN